MFIPALMPNLNWALAELIPTMATMRASMIFLIQFIVF